MFMKKFYLGILTIVLFISCFGQELNYTKTKALGFSFFLNDFQTASDIRTNGLVSVLKAGTFFKMQRMNPGLAVNYLSGISRHVDFSATLGGSFVAYAIQNKPGANSNNFLLETTAGLNFKMF